MTILLGVPLDEHRPLQFIVREQEVSRNKSQNALMWAGPLSDIEQQLLVGKRRYSAEVWHHQFKIEFLPEEAIPGKTKDTYRKWDYTPSGERFLVGSTSDLLVDGFTDYLEQIYAFGAEHGVEFS
jgi:hypothetical protein